MAAPDFIATIKEFNSPARLIDFVGGTRRAAEILGISQRSVERYVTTGKQKRNPSAATRQALIRAAGQRSAAGVGVTFDGDILIGSKPRRREINRVYAADDWEELSQLAEKGDTEGCWQFVADEYGVGDFHQLDGEILIGEE